MILDFIIHSRLLKLLNQPLIGILFNLAQANYHRFCIQIQIKILRTSISHQVLVLFLFSANFYSSQYLSTT